MGQHGLRVIFKSLVSRTEGRVSKNSSNLRGKHPTVSASAWMKLPLPGSVRRLEVFSVSNCFPYHLPKVRRGPKEGEEHFHFGQVAQLVEASVSSAVMKPTLQASVVVKCCNACKVLRRIPATG